jgi:hypothetical protein
MKGEGREEKKMKKLGSVMRAGGLTKEKGEGRKSAED